MRSSRHVAWNAGLAALLLASCAAPESAEALPLPDDPYVLVLGTAQDGGLPQIGCEDASCRAARATGAGRRRVASLLIVDPASGSRWLVDATPDLPEQAELARGHPPTRRAEGPRPPLFDGILLTHAHTGHYTGLVHLGREAYGARALPVHASPRMAEFLRTNGPWSEMVRDGHVTLLVLEPGGEALRLGERITVEPFRVPHRDELSDTLAFLIRGPERSVLYVPDADRFEGWSPPLESLLARADAALLDGTFFSGDEVPGRDLSKIPHPFVAQSIERFAALPARERAKIRFTHLNHTNPAADPASPEAARVRAAGMAIARDGDVIPLGADEAAPSEPGVR